MPGLRGILLNSMVSTNLFLVDGDSLLGRMCPSQSIPDPFQPGASVFGALFRMVEQENYRPLQGAAVGRRDENPRIAYYLGQGPSVVLTTGTPQAIASPAGMPNPS